MIQGVCAGEDDVFTYAVCFKRSSVSDKPLEEDGIIIEFLHEGLAQNYIDNDNGDDELMYVTLCNGKYEEM